ncbi:MAG TPA: ATP-binding protein, partial [Streptomyces sp.]|nr:ATP-binding protein [Streptomyces sp.]
LRPAVAPAGSATARQRSAAAEPAVKPGLWLAAFQKGVNGEPPVNGRTHPNTDESLDRDE